ncbi:hypothetical protein Dimus_015376 [Dionaea muscipula]
MVHIMDLDLNLDLGFSDDDGFAMWTPFLAVAASDVACLTGDLGLSKRFTFVKFTSKHDAEKAILKFNGQQFDNRTLAIDQALPKKIYTAAGNSAINFEDGSSIMMVSRFGLPSSPSPPSLMWCAWLTIQGSFLAVVAFDYACLADDLGLPCFADMGSILLRPPLPLSLPLSLNDAHVIGIGRGYVEDVRDSNQVLYEEQTLEEALYHFVRQKELLEFMDYQKVAKLLCVVDFGGLVCDFGETVL